MGPGVLNESVRWGLVGTALALSLGCAGSSSTPSGTSSSVTSGGAGSGGTSADPTGSGGSGAATGTGGTSDVGGTGAGGATGGAGGSATAPDAAGAAGMAGAGGDDGPLTCDSFSGDDPRERCEPKLRALLSSEGEWPILTFEYDAAGRIATVGDERSHASYFRDRYTYDDAGRLTRFESGCDGSGYCEGYDQFSYAPAGWLQVADFSGLEIYTYAEDGRVLEARKAQYLTRYSYRSDGLLEREDTFEVADDGVETPVGSALYDYGDDDLLDRYTSEFPAYIAIEYDYVLDAGRVRVEESLSDSYFSADIYDDFGNRTFVLAQSEGSDPFMSAYVDNSWCHSSSCYRYGSDWFRSVLPYRAFDLTEADIDDFSYSVSAPSGDYDFARRVTFSDDGLLEHLTLSFSSSSAKTVDIDTLRCGGGVAIETTEFSDAPDREETRVYYYGCDDFELPTRLPTL